jgi:hypothetical protein
MTTLDDDFEPKLGRIGTRDGNLRSRYLREVKQGIARAVGGKRGTFGSHRDFRASRIGHGAGAGDVLATRDHYAVFLARRVVSKTRGRA